MQLTITSIADRGNQDKERIVMKANADTDVGGFAIFRSLRSDTHSVTTDISDVFWFPDKDVKAGDLVVLYTKAGSTSERARDEGGTAHFFYWGKRSALWATTNKRLPVLVETRDWEPFSG